MSFNFSVVLAIVHGFLVRLSNTVTGSVLRRDVFTKSSAVSWSKSRKSHGRSSLRDVTSKVQEAMKDFWALFGNGK
jgi:hypothetical protein